MKLWIRGFAALLVAMALLSATAGLADVAEWAKSQTAVTARELRISNQRLALGAEVNADVDAKDITKKCRIRVSSNSEDRSRLTDDKVGTGWKYSGSDGWISVSLPSDARPGAIRLEWLYDPTSFELIEFDANEGELRRRTLADSFPGIYTMFALLPETRSVRLKLTAADQVVVNLAVYSEGVLPYAVQTWLPPVEKADLMVFSTHQDDEVIFLGGTIPYSEVVCGRPTITVYMTNCSRNRRREALEGLWTMGCRTYPEFINLKDEKVGSINEGIRLWGGKDNILKVMVERIRRYKPEVIVTQDFDGEYGHNQHKIMARATPYAIQAAADPAKYPDSYERYGAWQVKKLYIHLYNKNEIRMAWLTPQPALFGLTLLKVAQNGMAKHASQTQYFSVKNGGKYDNARFGLYMSTVGEDAAKNDFFENIEPDASAKYLAALRDAEAADTADGDAGSETDDAGGDAWSGAKDAVDAWSDAEGGEDGLPANTAYDLPDADIGTDPAATGAIDVEAGDPAGMDAPTATAPERRGGAGIAIALIGAGIAAAGAGAWYLLRIAGRRRRPARRRAGAKRPTGAGAVKARGKEAAPAAGRHASKSTGRHAAKR